MTKFEKDTNKAAVAATVADHYGPGPGVLLDEAGMENAWSDWRDCLVGQDDVRSPFTDDECKRYGLTPPTRDDR